MLPGLLVLLIIGGAAGLFATRVMRVNADLPTAVLIGVLGAFVGGLGLRAVLSTGGWAGMLVLATLGALALLWIYKSVRK